MNAEKTDLLIIGGGPAGYTASIYAGRAGLSPILYQGPQPGGQLTITSTVENYPGYPKGILGPKMMEDFEEQAARFNTSIRTGLVTAVNFSSNPFSLIIDNKHNIEAKAVIIATGSSAKWLGIPSEERLHGRGVSACATCDGFFFKGQDVVVVGGGDTAAEEALYLAALCNKVYVLVRRDVMRASTIMQKRILANPKISVLWHTEVEEILGEKEVASVRVINNQTKEVKEIPAQGFFVAIGHNPNTSLFTTYLNLNEHGYINTKPGTSLTSIPGVFAAGDVQDPIYRQAVTAAGSGCMAALDAERFLSLQAYNEEQ